MSAYGVCFISALQCLFKNMSLLLTKTAMSCYANHTHAPPESPAIIISISISPERDVLKPLRNPTEGQDCQCESIINSDLHSCTSYSNRTLNIYTHTIEHNRRVTLKTHVTATKKYYNKLLQSVNRFPKNSWETSEKTAEEHKSVGWVPHIHSEKQSKALVSNTFITSSCWRSILIQ